MQFLHISRSSIVGQRMRPSGVPWRLHTCHQLPGLDQGEHAGWMLLYWLIVKIVWVKGLSRLLLILAQLIKSVGWFWITRHCFLSTSVSVLIKKVGKNNYIHCLRISSQIFESWMKDRDKFENSSKISKVGKSDKR